MQHLRVGTRRHLPVESVVPVSKGSGRTPLQIADHNLRVTLEAIRREGPLTRLELRRLTGLTTPGITNIVRRLVNDGLVTAEKRVVAGNGQPSMEFALNPDGAFSVGLRLHGRCSEAVLIDLSGKVRDSFTCPPRGNVLAMVEDAMARFKATLPRSIGIIGIGIGSERPDAIDIEPLRTALAPRRVLVERDAVAAVLSERTLGIGAVDGGLVFVIIDEGVRAGLLLHGMPFGGVHGRAGGIGAMRTGADRVPLESVVGLDALRSLLTEEERGLLACGRDIPLTPAVRNWIKAAAGHLLDAIVATAGFVAPGAILIGGDLPRNLIEALIAQISVERGDTSTRPFATPWISQIRPASFDRAGIAVGAALLPFFDQLLPSPMTAATAGAR